MTIVLKLKGVRIKVFGCAACVVVSIVCMVFLVCIPSYRRTLIAHLRSWQPHFLKDTIQGVHEYDVYGPVYDSFSSECLRLPTTPDPPWVCIHNPKLDVYISAYIKNGDLWESESVSLFTELLKRDPDLGVVDIGANIGQYTLIGASLGRSVVAVDARLAHIQMLHHAVVLNAYQDRVHLIHNAVSDTRAIMSLQFTRDNQGATRVINARPCSSPQCSPPPNSAYHVTAVTLDDLQPFIPFHKLILKIDIEGDEVKAILTGIKFLQSLVVPFIIMEWEFLRKSEGEGEDVVDVLHSLGYQAHSINKQPLHNEKYHTWPNDIVWKHRTADL